MNYRNIYYNKYPFYSISNCLTDDIYNQVQCLAADFCYQYAAFEDSIRKSQLISQQQIYNTTQPEQEEFFDWEF